MRSDRVESGRYMAMVVDKYKALVAPNCKLDEDTLKTICQDIAEGNYIYVACEKAGIAKQTFYNWLERADKGEEPFIDVLDSLKKAEAEAECKHIATIATAGNQSWQALAWIRERKNPERWGQTQRIHQTVELSAEAKQYLAAHSAAAKRLEEATIEGEYKEIPP